MMHLNLLDGAPGVCARLGIYRSGYPSRPVPKGDCGHRINIYPGGYVTDQRFGVLCYACADRRHREDMRVDGETMGYLSRDGKTVTTWTGGVLLTVTRESVSEHHGFRWHKRTPVQARDLATGASWYGSGPGRGVYVRMRRHKRAPFCPGS